MSERLIIYKTRFNARYSDYLPENNQHVGEVYRALAYSFSVGGKRMRPALIYALADSLDIPLGQVDAVAVAVECIHTYSLIHDDLPDMDDDNMRRGHPTCHKKFNNFTAILAGDALNTLAFEILAKHSPLSPDKTLQQVLQLAQGAGISGMVGGQDTDLTCEKGNIAVDIATLSTLHQRKTARLIEAALLMTYCANSTVCQEKIALLSTAAMALGLYYQIQDDILEATQTSAKLGKSAQSDIDNGKVTYVSLLGLDQAQQTAHETATQVTESLVKFFAPTKYAQTPLAEIINDIMVREF